MGDSLSKKIQEMMQDKMLQAKVNQAIDMLKKGDSGDLSKKLAKIDKEELMAKVSEFDDEKINNLKIDRDEIKKKISQKDLDKLEGILGKDNEAIMKKVKEFMKS
jgi:FAD synthase